MKHYPLILLLLIFGYAFTGCNAHATLENNEDGIIGKWKDDGQAYKCTLMLERQKGKYLLQSLFADSSNGIIELELIKAGNENRLYYNNRNLKYYWFDTTLEKMRYSDIDTGSFALRLDLNDYYTINNSELWFWDEKGAWDKCKPL